MISSPIYTIYLPTFYFLYLYLFYFISLLLFGIPIFNKTLTYFTMSKLHTYIPFSCLFYILLLPFLIYTFTLSTFSYTYPSFLFTFPTVSSFSYFIFTHFHLFTCLWKYFATLILLFSVSIHSIGSFNELLWLATINFIGSPWFSALLCHSSIIY